MSRVWTYIQSYKRFWKWQDQNFEYSFTASYALPTGAFYQPVTYAPAPVCGRAIKIRPRKPTLPANLFVLSQVFFWVVCSRSRVPLQLSKCQLFGFEELEHVLWIPNYILSSIGINISTCRWSAILPKLLCGICASDIGDLGTDNRLSVLPTLLTYLIVLFS